MGIADDWAAELAALKQDVAAMDTLAAKIERAVAAGDDFQATLDTLTAKVNALANAVYDGPDAERLQDVTVKRLRAFCIAARTGRLGDLIDQAGMVAGGLEAPTAFLVEQAEDLFFPNLADAVGAMSKAVVTIDDLAGKLKQAVQAVKDGSASEEQAAALQTSAKDAFAALKELVDPEDNPEDEPAAPAG